MLRKMVGCKKRGLTTTTWIIVGIAILLLTAAITIGGGVPRIVNSVKVATGQLDKKVIEESNLYTLILTYLEQAKYNEALSLIDEYFYKFPNHERIYEIYYFKLYAQTKKHDYDAAKDTFVEFAKAYPTTFSTFDRDKDSDIQLYMMINFIKDNNIAGANSAISSSSLFFDNSNKPIYEKFNTGLAWPEMNNEYEVKVDPLPFAWYWYVKLKTENGEKCEASFIQNTFNAIFECYTQNDKICNSGDRKKHFDFDKTEVQKFYQAVKKICNNNFEGAMLKKVDENVLSFKNGQEKASNTRNNILSYYNFDPTFTYSSHIDLIAYFLNFMDINRLDENGIKPALSNSDRITLNAAILKGLNDKFKIQSDENLIIYYNFLAGFVYGEIAYGNIIESCTDEQELAFNDLLLFGGNMAAFRYNIQKQYYPEVKKLLFNTKPTNPSYLGVCTFNNAKDNYYRSYLSFNLAFDKISKSDISLKKLSYQGVQTNEDQAVVQKLKTFILPFYLQSTFISDSFSTDNANYDLTKGVLNNAYSTADSLFSSAGVNLESQDNFDSFNYLFEKIFINEISFASTSNQYLSLYGWYLMHPTQKNSFINSLKSDLANRIKQYYCGYDPMTKKEDCNI